MLFSCKSGGYYCVCANLSMGDQLELWRDKPFNALKTDDSLVYLEITQIRALLILYAYIVYTMFLWCANFCKFSTIFCLLLTVQQLYCATTSSRLGKKCIPRQIWG